MPRQVLNVLHVRPPGLIANLSRRAVYYFRRQEELIVKIIPTAVKNAERKEAHQVRM